MIRVLLGSALPLLGLGAAAAILGPDLVTGPRGEPLIMAAPDMPGLQAASLEGKACPSALIFADPSATGDVPRPAGARIVAFALRTGDDEVAVAVEDFPGGATTAARTVVLVFDEAGRLVAAGDPESLHVQAAIAPFADCFKFPEKGVRSPV